MGACDAPRSGSCTALGGQAAGTPRFSIPPVIMEAAVTPAPLGCAKDTAGGVPALHGATAPWPRGSRAEPGVWIRSGHAGEGWQTPGSFPRLMGARELREGPCGTSAIRTKPCPARIGGGCSAAGAPNSIGHGESCWRQHPAPIFGGKRARFASKVAWEALHKAKWTSEHSSQ